ncbi:MAG: hypothetical protein EA370_17070 [Wenzhouxiangella sp.]|nr:MAG: hypothetical protein EA370_17070 [Wenzhouxiangella sp.]
MSGGPRLHRASFSAGLRWLPAGAELMFRAPAGMIGIAALWLLLTMVAMLIPVLGQLLLVLFTPLLTGGVLLAFDKVRQGQTPGPVTLFAGWSDPPRRVGLILLGSFSLAGSMLAAGVLIGWLGSQLSPAELEAVSASPEALAQALAGANLGPGLLLAALLFSLVLAALFFAIPLILFGQLQALTALLASLRAVIINWLAFLGFGLAVMAMAIGLGVILALLMALLGLALGEAGMVLIQLLILTVTMFVQMLMAGAQYVAFCSVFGWHPGAGGDDSDERDDQLVA